MIRDSYHPPHAVHLRILSAQCDGRWTANGLEVLTVRRNGGDKCPAVSVDEDGVANEENSY